MPNINLITLDGFTLFSEYFIGISIFYILIVNVFLVYNVYGLMLQKAVSECIAIILLMACYLILNDGLLPVFSEIRYEEHDIITYIYQDHIAIYYNSIRADNMVFTARIIILLVSGVYFFIIAESLKSQRITSFEYLLITLFAVLGLILLCSSNDLLIAYLSIELISLSCYLLAGFKKTSIYSVESGIKYFIIGSLSSAFFLLGSSFFYGKIGSISISELYYLFLEDNDDLLFLEYFITITEKIRVITECCNFTFTKTTPHFLPMIIPEKIFGTLTQVMTSELDVIDIGLSLLLFSLYIKLALAPFHLWSLDVYEGSPTTATFFFAVVSKFSFFVFLLRLCYHLVVFRECWNTYSIWVGLFSIFVGTFGGLRQRRIKTLMAYSSISNMGYMILFFNLESTFAVSWLFYYLVVYVITGLSMWSIILNIRLYDVTPQYKHSQELGDFASLSKSNPGLAFAFSLNMFSVAGIPPLVGFLAKMTIIFSLVAMSSTNYSIALIILLFSVVSTFYYIRIVKIIYFENSYVGKLYYPITHKQALIISFLTFLLVYLFINPNILYILLYNIVFIFSTESLMEVLDGGVTDYEYWVTDNLLE